jgi:hypothetical protein
MNFREYLVAGAVVVAIAAGAYQWLGSALVALAERIFNLP